MADVTFVPNHQPAPACYPSDVNGMLDLLTTGGGMSGTIPDNAGGGIFVGSSPPSSALTNKVWYKTDGAGRPLGVYMFYNGNWRKIFTGVGIGEIRMCWFWQGQFDPTGRGLVGGDWDGWALCNGLNGTPQLQGQFPSVGVPDGAGNFYNSDSEGTWNHTGGAKGHITIQSSQLPYLDYKYHHNKVQSGTGTEVLTYSLTDPIDYDQVVDAGTKQPMGNQPLPYPIPYVAMGFIMFVGYQ